VPQYEVIVVLEPALSDEAVDGEINRVREIVGRLNGAVQEVQKWGKKRLAYEVRRRREAHYVLLKVDGPAALAAVGSHARFHADSHGHFHARAIESSYRAAGRVQRQRVDTGRPMVGRVSVLASEGKSAALRRSDRRTH